MDDHLRLIDARRLNDCLFFGSQLVESQDLDPLYPVLRALHRLMDLDREAALWHSLLYVAFYDLGSTQRAFAAVPEPALLPEDITRLRIAPQRRNMNGHINRHVASILALREHFGSLETWLTADFTDDPELDWYRLRKNARLVWGYGRYAEVKLAEVLMEADGFDVCPLDMANEGSSGPRWGLKFLMPEVKGNSPDAIAKLDEQGWRMQDIFRAEGFDYPLEHIETILCDYHHIATGNYYVGRDIDLMQTSLLAVPGDIAWRARKEALPRHYLGEFGGWTGLDKPRLKVYRDRGVILTRRPDTPTSTEDWDEWKSQRTSTPDYINA